MPLHFLHLWFLPWSQMAVSLFNTVLLLWLGLTVLLNNHNRTWGTWLAGFGLLIGGGFFLGHTAALDFTLEALIDGSPGWWLLLAIPLLSLPYGWLVLMMWSCGFWDDGALGKRRRRRWPFVLTTAFFLNLAALCIYAAPHAHKLPFFDLMAGNDATYLGMRAILLLYPPFLVLCTATALWALANPEPSGRMMTEESRRRARPWLLASSLVQLLVSLGVACGLVFFGYQSFHVELYNLYGEFSNVLDWVDLVLETAISVAVMLLGKAVVSFEIFTGKVLPRRGFWRQWRAIVALAAFYASLVSASLGFDVRPIYPILLTTGLMSVFLAIFSFRAYSDRERAVTNLVPFVASQHLTAGLLAGATEQFHRALDEPFRALCEDVLNSSRAALLARGAMSGLAGAPRLYPPTLPFNPLWAQIVSSTSPLSRDAISLPADCGMNYLVPLGGEENSLGALLLGPRRDGGLYTVEEIEVARAAGEHLLDSQAGATLAARLVELQRQKLAEVQVLDRHARRVLHDDILPLLHGALLSLSSQDSKEAMASLTAAHKGISDLLRDAPPSSSPLARRDFWIALKHEIEVEFAGCFDEVNYDISTEAAQFTLGLPPLLADTLFFAAREAVRNAAKYGRGEDVARQLTLKVAAKCDDTFELELRDNGVGLGSITPSPIASGSGSGLALHGTLLAIAGGKLNLENLGGEGARVVLILPARTH